MAHGGLLVSIIFVLLLCASGVGMYLHDRLGERHRTSETKDHVRLVVSILVTFTALVLSLMLSEVKGSFDTFDARLRAFAGDISNLDIHLREYGPGRRSDQSDGKEVRGRGDRRQLAQTSQRRRVIFRALTVRRASSDRSSAPF